MLESVREIHGHVNKQMTNHSSATEREIARWFSIQQFSCSTRKKLENSRCQTGNKVARFCCA